MALSASDQDILDRYVRALVTDDVIAENRANPYGPHSAALTEIHDFLRRNPDPDRPRYLVLVRDDGYVAAKRMLPKGTPPTVVDPTVHATRADVEHALFLRRLADYGLRR